MTNGSRVMALAGMCILAQQVHANLITGFPANSENGCIPAIELNAPGYSCSYNESSLRGVPEFAPHTAVPWASVAGWQGPIYLGGFYAVGSAPGVANPGGIVAGGKTPPALQGDITVTGSGASAQVSMAVSYAASDYSFNDGRGNFGDIRWGSLIFGFTGRTVDHAISNGSGFDYLIGSLGHPAPLTSQAGGTAFPDEVAATGLNYWNSPGTAINYPDTVGIATHEYFDYNWDAEVSGQTGQFLQNFGVIVQGNFGTVLSCVDTFGPASACAGWNIINDPSIKLIMRISTDGAGEVVSGQAFAVREGDLITGPGGLLGASDSFAATVWTFSQTTATDGDGDGIVDTADNCPNNANGPVITDAYGTSQGDHDGDGMANACDTDDDNDSTPDVSDGCPIDALGTVDVDADGACDYYDNCPVTPNGPWILDPADEGIPQRDTDSDTAGDACDSDDDNDGLSDVDEATAGSDRLNPDTDGDGVLDGADEHPTNPAQSGDADSDGLRQPLYDNCTNVANFPDAGGNFQLDSNGDGYGNACDADLNNDGIVNGLDVAPYVSQFGTGGPDADFNGDGIVNGLDVGTFINSFGQAPGPSALAP